MVKLNLCMTLMSLLFPRAFIGLMAQIEFDSFVLCQ